MTTALRWMRKPRALLTTLTVLGAALGACSGKDGIGETGCCTNPTTGTTPSTGVTATGSGSGGSGSTTTTPPTGSGDSGPQTGIGSGTFTPTTTTGSGTTP
jgi:hypothetical protein